MRFSPVFALTFLLAASLSTSSPAAPDHPAHDTPAGAPGTSNARAATLPPNPLPAPATTSHTLILGDRTLHFKATAGAIRLNDATTGAAIADIGYVAYQLEDASPRPRALTVAINGGPGASSAWLDLGAMGPWRLPFREALSPSARPTLADNAGTWLDFTDLLFIDPPGTGYSRLLGKDDGAHRNLYTVDGDIATLAVVIRKWMFENGRLSSPAYIVGESYGGFRAPKLARRLERSEGIGIGGLVMISPVLDFAWFQADDNPAIHAMRLPSLVAAAQGINSENPRDKLQAAEAYASGPYLTDLFKGVRDSAAVKRMSAALAGYTGLDAHFIERLGGRIDASVLTREKNRDALRVASAYDSGITGFDREPFDIASHGADPVLDTIKVPLATAMASLTAGALNWPVDAVYETLNRNVAAHWDWGGAKSANESISDLQDLLALDPNLHVLIAHGVSDQVTPYFTTQMLINQIPAYGDPGRVKLMVYPGGHMLYIDDRSRAAFREDARKLIQGIPEVSKPVSGAG